MRHLNWLVELKRSDIEQMFRVTAALKQQWKAGHRPSLLEGCVLTQVFEKPSLRTRVSFESAMMQLGGSSIFLSSKDAGLGGREAVQDVARVLGGYSDVIVLRTFSQQLIDEFVKHANCPIINGLSDLRHPCQAITDLYTMQEVCGLTAGKFVFVGDGNNVATSLAVVCSLLKVPFVVCAPPKHQLSPEFISDLRLCVPGANITQTTDFGEALADAAIVYTDVWTSMGQEDQDAERRQALGPFQINADLMKLAPKTCRFMHCLPAKRGREVTDDVMDGAQSVVFQQAANRMHIAKALLLWVLERDREVASPPA
jgi:ornithine carbamoyltransferase